MVLTYKKANTVCLKFNDSKQFVGVTAPITLRVVTAIHADNIRWVCPQRTETPMSCAGMWHMPGSTNDRSLFVHLHFSDRCSSSTLFSWLTCPLHHFNMLRYSATFVRNSVSRSVTVHRLSASLRSVGLNR